jgi:lipoic acid synthetase
MLELDHVVITSVTRDDLADGGAHHFAATIRAVRELLPKAGVEVLVPDFGGSPGALEVVMAARPDVLNHNVETVPRLYPRTRPQADYVRSLRLLAQAKRMAPSGMLKSGFMVGLGEHEDEVLALLRDLCAAGVDVVTIGQYLQPTTRHLLVDRYVEPEEFSRYECAAREIGFARVLSGPLVRSSYHAGDLAEAACGAATRGAADEPHSGRDGR